LSDRASTAARYELTLALSTWRESEAAKPKSAFPWFTQAPRLPMAPAVIDTDNASPEASSGDDEPSTDEEAHTEAELEAEWDREVEEERLAGQLAPEPMPLPKPGFGSDVEPSSLPSGTAMGGARGQAPVFAVIAYDALTLRALPNKRGGPSAATIAEQASKGRRWDGAASRWEPIGGTRKS
jgi:hypothetical protein